MAKKKQATPKDSLLVTASKSLGTAAGKLASAIGIAAPVEPTATKAVKKKAAPKAVSKKKTAKKAVAPKAVKKTTRKSAK